ncbi:SCP-2 sterol transfer family protein [Mycolicibacterium vaccae]|uniref:SCP-2 sterol transfer family protein n=1 Tax=Mycolicibacterium vaccae TaxID=1810 RepID=UPI003CEDDFA2
MAELVSTLLQRSVDHLADEVPDSYRRTARTLGEHLVALHVDDERFCLTGGNDLVVVDHVPGAHVHIATARSTIVEILDGHLRLEAAVQDGAVAVRGALDDVLRVHDTLRAYVHAAVRAPAQAGLMDALRAGLP